MPFQSVHDPDLWFDDTSYVADWSPDPKFASQDPSKMDWVFQSLHDQWLHQRFTGELISLRDITGRVELKGIGYVDVALYKRGLLRWILNKKMDDYPSWPADQQLLMTKCWSSHDTFRKYCGYSPNPSITGKDVDLTWLGTISKSLARLHSFVEANAFQQSVNVHVACGIVSPLRFLNSVNNSLCIYTCSLRCLRPVVANHSKFAPVMIDWPTDRTANTFWAPPNLKLEFRNSHNNCM